MNAHEFLLSPIGYLAPDKLLDLGQVILLRQLAGTWPPPAGSWTW